MQKKMLFSREFIKNQ